MKLKLFIPVLIVVYLLSVFLFYQLFQYAGHKAYFINQAIDAGIMGLVPIIYPLTKYFRRMITK